jgi:filamentous hemagglutinin family protein
LVGPNYSIGANLGKQVGSNLFHSFGQFSLANTPVPERATFTSTGSIGPIGNVIGRVTGGGQSNINGAVVSVIPSANLYLINPSGIVFGPNATVNVLGSFHASTADYVKMADGSKFQATNPDSSTLSAAPPVAFGFLTASPPAITVNGSTLGVPQGQTLGLIGGGTAASPTAINGATLKAPAGTIHVTSAAGTGEVPVDPRNKSALTVTSLGPVAVTGGSTLDVSNPSGLGSGGSVFIRSGALSIATAVPPIGSRLARSTLNTATCCCVGLPAIRLGRRRSSGKRAIRLSSSRRPSFKTISRTPASPVSSPNGGRSRQSRREQR